MDLSCKTTQYVILVVGLVGAGFLLWQHTDTPSVPQENKEVGVTYATTTVTVGTTTLVVDIANTQPKRTNGLSGRVELEENHGMLFVFPEPDTYGIWMKDMRFPIDIFWLNAKKEVIHIKRNATPESYPESFRPLTPALYVLETKPGVVSPGVTTTDFSF